MKVKKETEQYQKAKRICIQPFKLLCLAANGDVMPCSVDWKRKLLLGNINNCSLVDIWKGKKREELLMSLLKEEPCSLCSHCGYSIQNQPDDIDDYKAEIIDRLINED